jgi:hypothetical protein
MRYAWPMTAITGLPPMSGHTISAGLCFCGEPLSIRGLFEIWGRHPWGMVPRLWMPRSLMYWQMALLEPLQRMLGLPAFLSREKRSQRFIVPRIFERNTSFAAAFADRVIAVAQTIRLWVARTSGVKCYADYDLALRSRNSRWWAGSFCTTHWRGKQRRPVFQARRAANPVRSRMMKRLLVVFHPRLDRSGAQRRAYKWVG